MIDIFNQLYTGLTTSLVAYFPNLKTSSTYTNSPATYPFVSVEEIGDSVYENGGDSGDIENFANKDYEINIYTTTPLPKANADKIKKVVDDYMKAIGFTRTTCYPMPTNDEKLYRIVMRYRGVVSKNKTVYRR